MSDPEVDLLGIECGSVTAPAGCGKTWLIADALWRHNVAKPVLILTHTNAGVSALRKRLHDNTVDRRNYRLLTIDGWAMRLISTFPARSGLDPTILAGTKPNYPKIHSAANGLLRSGHIDDVVKASYSRLLVDEYQDCSVAQHAIVDRTAELIPTIVLGDPLQAIFGFRGNKLVRWNEDVRKRFPEAGRLQTPHRWIRAGAEPLGTWFLDAYDLLLAGKQVDVRQAPGVTWEKLTGTSEDDQRRRKAAQIKPPTHDGRVLILADSTKPAIQQDIARSTPGAITVEAVDLRDLVDFARLWKVDAPAAVTQLIEFAARLMRGIDKSGLMERIPRLAAGTARKGPGEIELAALEFRESPSHASALKFLEVAERQPDVRAHRASVLHALRAALRTSVDSADLQEAVLRQRDQYRAVGRALPRRGVGSTLLCKGLEVEVVVLLNADDLDAPNLYVAMTRASKRVIVCSTTPLLPAQPTEFGAA